MLERDVALLKKKLYNTHVNGFNSIFVIPSSTHSPMEICRQKGSYIRMDILTT